MMRKYTTLALALLFAASPALAAESVFSGDLSLSGQLIDGSSKLSAKYSEYRDLGDNDLSGSFSLFGAEAGRFLSVDGAKLGQEDQSLKMQWGLFDTLRFSLFHDQLTHNYSFDDLTIYSGAGTDTLTIGASAITNPATWLPIDYSVERKVLGGGFKANFGSPYFVSFDVTQTEKKGTLPWGVNHSTGGGSYFVELPLPIDDTTTNLTAKAGYGSKTLLASVDFTVSSFDNDYDRLSWARPTAGVAALTNPHTFTTTTFLPPDNEMWQIGGQLVLKQLPLNSVLALRGSHSQLESSDSLPAVVNSLGAPLTGARSYDGDITYTTAAVNLRSRPLERLETDLTYRYVKKDNEAGGFLYGGPTTGATAPVSTHVFYYTKHNAAAEAAYRVTDNNRVALGYDFTKIDRAEEMRHDAEETKDHLVSAEWKNSTFDFLTAKLRYEHLERNTLFNGAVAVNPPAPTQDASIIYAYARPLDAADKSQDTFKVALDLTPCSFADVGLEYSYRTADYDKTVIGRTDDLAHKMFADISVALPGKSRLYGYAGYEQIEAGSDHVYYTGSGTGTVTVLPVPAASENTNRYNWSQERIDETRSFGARLEVPFFEERLKLSAAWDYEKNEGEAKFKSTLASIDKDMRDIDNYGNYTKRTLSLKAEYAMTAALTLIGGYAYEKYDIDDIQYNDYVNTFAGPISSGVFPRSYLTGAYADADYNVNLGYVTLAYKF